MTIRLTNQIEALAAVAAMLQSGFTLANGLAYLGLVQPRYSATWHRIDAGLAAGQSFGDCLKAERFHPTIVGAVRLAAVHGQLADSLVAVTAELKTMTQERQQLRHLLTYPLILLGALAGMQFGFWFWLQPLLGLPVGWRTQWNWWLGGVIGAVVVSLWQWRRLPAVTKAKVWLHLPVVRGVMVTYYQYQVAKGCAQFLAVGQPLAAYFEQLAGDSSSSYSPLGQQVVTHLQAGQALDQALDSPLIPAALVQLVTTGQPHALMVTGSQLVARQLFNELKAKMDQRLTWLQPVLFIVIAGQVVWFYWQILQPLYQSGGW